jgi:hypothetical protein
MDGKLRTRVGPFPRRKTRYNVTIRFNGGTVFFLCEVSALAPIVK